MTSDGAEGGFALRGKFVGLRPVRPEDLPLIFAWWTDKDEVPLWTSQFRQVTTYQQFLPMAEGWLRDTSTFMLVDLADGARFGFARAYNLNLADGWVWWQVYVEPAYRSRGQMGEWAALFSRYIFEQFPVRKLCGEIFAFNAGVVKLHEKLGFRFEGRLKEHTWYRDRYWDHLFYSLSREGWSEAMRRYGFISAVEEDLAASMTSEEDTFKPAGRIPA
jgi:RimJ/RimL family protein N-acetyltransferase